ncbi:MAG: hypothetical protein E6J08_10010 [Chloroflexi bacterium]|nr:MAG: hypothetical protein E6J08_10010 [Chloroflexota bacterium]
MARDVPEEDADELRALVEEHLRRTGSRKAAEMLASWDEAIGRFRQIVPVAPPEAQAAAAPQEAAETAPKTAA